MEREHWGSCHCGPADEGRGLTIRWDEERESYVLSMRIRPAHEDGGQR